MLLLSILELGALNLNVVNGVFHMGHKIVVSNVAHSTINNYMEILVDDEITMLEYLNRLCGTKHDIFSEARRQLPMEMQTLKINEANDKTIGFGPMDVMKEGHHNLRF